MSGVLLFETPFSDLLPDSLRHDSTVQTVCQSLDKLLFEIQKKSKEVAIWSRVDEIDEPLLSNLGWQVSLTHEYAWKLAKSEQVKRDLIKNAMALHRYKGTPWSIRELVRLLGFGEIDLIEGLNVRHRDGSVNYNGFYFHGAKGNWASYRVVFKQALTQDDAELLKKAIPQYAPLRCELVSLEYPEMLFHNGTVRYRNGAYNRGRA